MLVHVYYDAVDIAGFDDKVKAFFEEHIHDAEEIRYIISGSGFFDVRDADDKWVRVHIKKGDLMTLPEGIYHRYVWQYLTSVLILKVVFYLPGDLCVSCAFECSLLLYVVVSPATRATLFMQ